MAAKLFAVVPRLFSRIGLGSLSFTVDPAWLLPESQPPAAPIVVQFLRIHREALAEEWKSRQSPAQEASSLVVTPEASEAQDMAPGVPKLQGEKGLPSWFGLYCATGEGTKPKVEARPDKPARARIAIPSKPVAR
jgi:hypothetical protein